MISGWNCLTNRNTVTCRMNMNLYTGGGYRNYKGNSSIFHALIATTIGGYVYPVIYNVFFRQHRCMLSFLRACIRMMRYTAAGDCRGYR